MQINNSIQDDVKLKLINRRKMQKIFKNTIVIFLIINLVSCGAIFHGTIQDITITAPSDALIKVNGRTTKGSAIVSLKRNKSYLVTMYRNEESFVCGEITNTLSGGAVAGDIILLIFFLVPGIAAFVIDGVTGAWYNLEPEQVMCRE